jgi:hypothetical protein
MTLSLVVGTAAGLLRGLDALPGYVTGEPPGIKRLRSVEDAETSIRDRVIVPPYFPDSLHWPPVMIVAHAGPPASVALTFADAAGEPALVVFQSRDPRVAPRELVAPAVVLQRATVSMPDGDAELLRVLTRDGAIWHEIVRRSGERRVVLRFRGPVDQLVRMARSVRDSP